MTLHPGFIKNRWSLLTLMFGLAVSTILAWQLHQSNELRAESVVAEAAALANTAVVQRLELYQYGLRGARGAVLSAGKERLDRELFHRYSLARDIDREFPGARGFGFIRRVPQADTDAFVELARANGWPDFRITELNAHDSERYVIQYIEPVDRNIEAVGLDIGSEKTRRVAADAAMRSGKVRLSGPITLVQASGKPLQSFLILMPVYRNGITPATEAEREQQAIGWSYAPLLMEEVLSALNLDVDAAQLELFDVTLPGESTRFYSSNSQAIAPLSAYTQTIQFEAYGRLWESRFSVGPAFIAALRLSSPLQFFLLGALISLLAALLIGTTHLSRQRRHQVLDEQARLAAIVESSADGIIGKTLDGVITSWNRGAEQLFGYPAQVAIGKPLSELVIPEELQHEEVSILKRVRKGEHIPHFETLRQRQDGSRFHVSVTISPIFNSAGQVSGASKTVRDITSQKEAEARVLELNSHLEAEIILRTAELTATRDQLLMAADIARLGIWSWTLADNSLDWNDKMFELYDYPMTLRDTGLDYQHWYDRVHPDDIESTRTNLAAAVTGDALFDLVFRIVLPDGRIRYIQGGAQIERDEQGEATHLIGVNLDITSQRELETGLRQAKARADEASAAKSTFLSNMSHEIRTPLNAVLGMLQLVQQTALDQRQRDYIAKTYKAARSLLGLLNDILDYSKIEAGKLQLEPHPFELEGLMQELAVVLSGNLGTKPVELMFDFSPSLPGSLIGDRLRLQQVLINLAGNAIKFTEQGEVVIALTELSRGPEWMRLRVDVSDTGIGIAEDKLDYILEGFNQAEASTARRFGGTGLGLVISKRLLALMGTELHVRSTLGKGSCFWFEVVLGLEQEVPPLVTAEVSEPPLRVLVVDDHHISADILARVACQQGWRVSIANSGQEALLEVQQNNDYDLVLMDWAMPDMNGLEAARRIRTLVQEHLPTVIMITAYGREQLAQAQQTANPPFTDFLTKPVTPQQLISTVQRALAGETMASEYKAIPAPSRQRLIGLRLLVVEDNALNRQVAAELLRGEGAVVELAEGGLEGVSKVVGALTAFDMVLMDMQMPDIDGLEATRRIRAHGACLELPILAMTANVSMEDQRACLAAGMNAHIGKPVDIEQLVAVLLSFCSNSGGLVVERAGESQVEVGDDIAAIIRRFGGDAGLYQRLLIGFEKEAGALFDELERYAGERDRLAAAATLHTFRGAAGTMGAASFAARLSALEQQLGEQNTEKAFSSLNAAALSALKAQLAQERTALLEAVSIQVTGVKPVASVEAIPDRDATENGIKAQLEPLLALLEAGNMDAIDCFERLPVSVLESLSHQRDVLTDNVQNLDFAAASRIVRERLEAL